jgi:methylthioribulose-1-phosphate dehydratase
MMGAMPVLADVARALVDVGRQFHARGWVLGTSGNFSTVLETDPLRLAITPSGADKGALSPEQLLEIDADGAVLQGRGRPSDETKLHLAVVRVRGAGAVLHTHSVWSTLLSTTHAREGGVAIEQLEMLKGLAGVKTHAHREWLPIFENSQDLPALSGHVADALAADPRAHGFLLRGHGLYTWGRDLDEARRHVEIFEFLLEVTGRLEKGD